MKKNYNIDGPPCAMKVACTVRHGGKVGDNLKDLPIVYIAVSEWKALKKETKLKLLRYAMLESKYKYAK
ncbi:hypothetical protein [Bacillus paramycoides]|uniref:hypothetical protein n=2 Tax=Bacillus paramycoides TaxID=2026194 RepID=UPI003D046FF5